MSMKACCCCCSVAPNKSFNALEIDMVDTGTCTVLWEEWLGLVVDPGVLVLFKIIKLQGVVSLVFLQPTRS